MSNDVQGGAEQYEGYNLVGSVSEDDDQSAEFAFDDLQPQVRIHEMSGVSVVLEQPVQNGPDGRICARLIHDFKARAYIFRKDEPGVSIFRVGLGINVD